ncbi:hypothetical protein KY328_01300 [Candidatus Woesearchaeota archaeon]|nr:hypothetical protein [Candidatus Woesearchaeota archaeon]MBW3021534.1 hypothetical protein [Candidatus Woesearchaeota archaeon]
MEFDAALEKILWSEVLPLLRQGRPKWDIPHTKAVVHHMKQIILGEGGDPRILLAAAIFHDNGYFNLPEGYNFEESMEAKEMHAVKGAFNAGIILPRAGYTPNEVYDVKYLIVVHDNYDCILTPDHQKLFEADTLGQLDWERVPPNFDIENVVKYMDYVKSGRLKKFKTRTGIKLLKEIMPKCEKYIKDRT